MDDPNKKRGAPWTDEEIAVLKAHPDLSAADMVAHLPHRTAQAIGNVRGRRDIPRVGDIERPTPAVKAPGIYTEILADLLVDEFELLDIWARWNGYATAQEVARDKSGWVTLACTAK